MDGAEEKKNYKKYNEQCDRGRHKINKLMPPMNIEKFREEIKVLVLRRRKKEDRQERTEHA